MSIGRQIIFVAVFLSVLALINYYVYRRFFRQLSPRLHRVGGLFMVTIMGGEVVLVVDMVANFFPESLAIYMTLSACIGFTFMLFVVTLIYDLTVSVSRRVPFDLERRRAIKIFRTAARAAVVRLWSERRR